MDASPPTFSRAAPVLQVSNILKSRDFYRDKLGFREFGMWGEPSCFCILGRGAITIFLDQSLSDSPVPVNQYWAAYLYVSDAEALAAEFRERGVEIIRGPEDAPHGCREIDVRDPDGHILCFGQDLEPPTAGPGL